MLSAIRVMNSLLMKILINEQRIIPAAFNNHQAMGETNSSWRARGWAGAMGKEAVLAASGSTDAVMWFRSWRFGAAPPVFPQGPASRSRPQHQFGMGRWHL